MKLVDKLINEGTNVNKFKFKMYTPLILAIIVGHIDCVNVLIQHHANINQMDAYEDWTPLMYAAYHKHDDILLTLLKAGAATNKKSKITQMNAVMISAKQNSVDCLKILIEYQSSLNQQNNTGETALILATEYSYIKCLQLLLKHKACNDTQDIGGRTALIHAANDGDSECVKILIDSNANLNITDHLCDDALLKSLSGHTKSHQTCSLLLIKAGCLVNQTNLHGNTPLDFATMYNRSDIINELITRGANVNHCNNNITPLWLAANRGYDNLLKILLDTGADPNIGRPPLVASARNSDSSVNSIKILLEAGADINAVDYGTMMVMGTQAGKPEVVKIGLNEGALINISNIIYSNVNVKSEDAWMLLFAAGEKCDYFYCRKGAPQTIIETKTDFRLQNLCRKTIRKHLLITNPKQNLFRLVNILPVPKTIQKFLLYNVSL